MPSRRPSVTWGRVATAVAVLRARHGLELSRPGADADSHRSTDAKDRQILADAVAAGARFLITENVADFGLVDLLAEEVARYEWRRSRRACRFR